VQRRQSKGKEPPEESAFVADLVHQMTLSCLTGNVVAALLRLGYGDDPRLWQAVDWLVSIQNTDGGWLCPYWKAHIRTLGVNYDQAQPSKSAKARSGRPNWRLSQMQKLCKDTLAAKRVRSPWSE